MMELFGYLPDGTKIHRISIQGSGLQASFLTYGAILQNLQLEGHHYPLVLGFPDFAPYLDDSPYFGATVGRCANRIRDGHLQLGNKPYQLDRNFLGKHSLHGGSVGIGKRNWTLSEYGNDFVHFDIVLNDCEMGFPGNMAVRAEFKLMDPGVLDIVYTATTDAPTLCNITNHTYFNLSGENNVLNHLLQVDADHFLPVDDELIPTGEIKHVANHDFDFRSAKPLKAVARNHLIDHNFCLSRNKKLKKVASLFSPISGVHMVCKTTEPGLQIYAGKNINTRNPGFYGSPMGPYAGLAMEAQIWPDAHHHEHFPDALLTQKQTYRHNTQYIFSKGE